MSEFTIYNKRLNRYGQDVQERLQGKREKGFETYLARSPFKTSFKYKGQSYIGSFERYRQDETKTLHYLLTDINLSIEPGTVLEIQEKGQDPEHWMVYYLEHIEASGYNRHIMLRMTHKIKWLSREGYEKFSWAYMYGQENNMLKDELKSRSRMDTLYTENLKASFFIMPKNEYIQKEVYLIIDEGTEFQEQYRVTGYDRQSTSGVMYVTIDPVYEYDLSPAPTKQEGDDGKDFYWLNYGQED